MRPSLGLASSMLAVCIYIYAYRERERERETHCMYIYIYANMCICIYMSVDTYPRTLRQEVLKVKDSGSPCLKAIRILLLEGCSSTFAEGS